MNKYSFDIMWTVAKNFVVQANSEEEARKHIEELLNKGVFSCWDAGWEATDDVVIEDNGECDDNDSPDFIVNK